MIKPEYFFKCIDCDSTVSIGIEAIQDKDIIFENCRKQHEYDQSRFGHLLKSTHLHDFYPIEITGKEYDEVIKRIKLKVNIK